MNNIGIAFLSVLVYAIVIDMLILKTPRKIRNRILRRKAEQRKQRQLDLQPVSAVSLDDILEMIGSQDRDTAKRILANQLNNTRERVMSYLSSTNNRVRSNDIQELGNIRRAYEIVGLQWPTYEQPQPVSVTIPPEQPGDVQQWRDHIRKSMLSTSNAVAAAPGRASETDIYKTIKGWMDSEFSPAEANRLLGQLSVQQ